MQKQSKLTRTGLITAAITLCFMMVWFYLFTNKIRMPRPILCSTQLKGLSNAFLVYANDYDGKYPQLGKGPWSKQLGYPFDDPQYPAPATEQSCTITSSWYLLVREVDVSPISFICPESDETEFDGTNKNEFDIVQLWDFGPDPYSHVSYAYHNPYGKFPVKSGRPASFAVAADMSPWFKKGDILQQGKNNEPPQVFRISKFWSNNTIKPANSTCHEQEGQNIIFADGHSSFEKQPNVGVKNDNIYTFWSTDENPTEQDKQGGTAPTSRSPENDAKSADDSFLAI